jgi:YVTN family beta-propeller protein
MTGFVVGNNPLGVVVNPAGTRVCVTHAFATNNVSVIDTATNTVVAMVPVASGKQLRNPPTPLILTML